MTTFYFKVGQALFQNGARTVTSKWVKVYFKVGQKLFQNRTVTARRGEMLLQSGTVISKWGTTIPIQR